MKTNYVLIDFENVQVQSLGLLSADHFRVHLFLGPNHKKLPTDLAIAMHELSVRANYVRLETPGPNALDFHLAYYLGQLAAADPAGFYHIISKDTGFDPLVQHRKTRKIFAARSESIETMPCFRAAAAAHDAVAPPPPVPESAGTNAKGMETLVQLVVDDLIKRKAAKPRKVATLRSTVRARLGQDDGSLDAVIAALVGAGYVVVDGDQVGYRLPAR